MNAIWILLFSISFLWSAIRPHDYFTWFLEVAPAAVAFVILLVTRKRFLLTNLSYILILVHSIILMVGGHYTYAEVPLFDWVRDVLHQSRNNYDKLGHFAQGFIPAIIAREILIRKSVVRRGPWLVFIVISICLGVSAFYELVEWWTAELSGTAAEAFLGTQGYQWDTQSDMAFALVGATVSLLLFSRIHDQQLGTMSSNAG